MTPEENGFAIERVVVALECACENLAALERAADLARRVRARLHAMFIEDARLLDLAALPFTRQVSLSSGSSVPLEPGDVEAEFRVLASRARRRLELLAGRLNVAASFEIVRGGHAAALTAAGGGDLLVVESTTRSVGQHLRMPTDWVGRVAQSGHACLLLGPTGDSRHNVVVLHDGTPAADRAWAAAKSLGSVDHTRLVVLRLPQAPEAAELRRRFSDIPARTTFHDLKKLDSAALRAAIAGAECGLVIAPASLIAAQRAALADFLAAPSCALLMMV